MRLAALTRAFALGVLLLVPTTARADQASTITITLKNGAQYRGELVEKVPDDHVTIKLATGETPAWSTSRAPVARPPRPTRTRATYAKRRATRRCRRGAIG